jgi:hypothetical protein
MRLIVNVSTDSKFTQQAAGARETFSKVMNITNCSRFLLIYCDHSDSCYLASNLAFRSLWL